MPIEVSPHKVMDLLLGFSVKILKLVHSTGGGRKRESERRERRGRQFRLIMSNFKDAYSGIWSIQRGDFNWGGELILKSTFGTKPPYNYIFIWGGFLVFR